MIYVGKHQTENKNDDYMGSGQFIRQAIKTEGIENFEKTILFECKSEEEMNQKEAEIVNEEFVNREDTYNVALGGYGSWNHVNKSFTKEQRSQCIKEKWQNENYRNKIAKSVKLYYDNLSIEEKKQRSKIQSQKLKKYYSDSSHIHSWKGRHHTEETKKKIHEIYQTNQHQQGSKNSNYGKHWWKDPNDKTKSMSIKEGDPVPEGWIRGRWSLTKTKQKIEYCKYCGAVKGKCMHPSICNRHQFILGYKRLFHPNENIFGLSFYDILFKDIYTIYEWYFSEKISIPDIGKRLHYTNKSPSSLYSCIESMLKIINSDIKLRTFSEASQISRNK